MEACAQGTVIVMHMTAPGLWPCPAWTQADLSSDPIPSDALNCEVLASESCGTGQ